MTNVYTRRPHRAAHPCWEYTRARRHELSIWWHVALVGGLLLLSWCCVWLVSRWPTT